MKSTKYLSDGSLLFPYKFLECCRQDGIGATEKVKLITWQGIRFLSPAVLRIRSFHITIPLIFNDFANLTAKLEQVHFDTGFTTFLYSLRTMKLITTLFSICKKLALCTFTFALSSSFCIADLADGSQMSGFSGFVKNWTGYVPILLVFGVFYFLVIRPQNKKRKALEDMIKSVKTGDHIITHSGMFGSVSECAERHFKLEVAKGVKIKMLKSSIAFVETSNQVDKDAEI